MAGTRRTTRTSPRKSVTKSPKKKIVEESDEERESDVGEDDAYEEEHDSASDESAEEIDSDNLDGWDDSQSKKRKKKTNGSSPKKVPSPKKAKTKESPKRTSKKSKKDDDESAGEELDEDGLEVVGEIVKAPTTGLAPPGQISRNTLNFLKELQDPEKNDRTWFKLHEPVYRQAEKEFKAFLDELTDVIMDADPQIPHLPPKDVIHRIYRDIRFSNDKTPYKTNFSASFSRSGRKGIFAGYHISIKSGGSFLASGTWCPDKNEINTMRHNIQRNSSRLRNIISSKEFVKFFGPPKPHSNGERQSLFGREDELKVAPKGIDKNHEDIDLLKLRSFAVSCQFTDSEVLEPDFKDRVGDIIKVLRPFVHCLNDLMTIRQESNEESE